MSTASSQVIGKYAFGNINKEMYQSDYISRKKNKLICCNTVPACNRNPTCTKGYNKSYSNLYAFKKCRKYHTDMIASHTNLVTGQYSKINLEGVCQTMYQPSCVNTNNCGSKCAVPFRMVIDSVNGRWMSGTSAFYNDVIVDPLGQLFGNSDCDKLNYYRYREF